MDLLYMDGRTAENMSNLPWYRALEEMVFWVYLQNGWIQYFPGLWVPPNFYTLTYTNILNLLHLIYAYITPLLNILDRARASYTWMAGLQDWAAT